MPISFKNSRFPCFDPVESCFTAIIVPSDNFPCNQITDNRLLSIDPHKLFLVVNFLSVLTLYTGPKPPSPILFAESKLFVAILICLNEKEAIRSSKLLKSDRRKKQQLSRNTYKRQTLRDIITYLVFFVSTSFHLAFRSQATFFP